MFSNVDIVDDDDDVLVVTVLAKYKQMKMGFLTLIYRTLAPRPIVSVCVEWTNHYHYMSIVHLARSQ